MADAEPSLDVARHLKYWKMCLQYPLPDLYLSNETNRIALAYFIVSSVTLLTSSGPASEGSPKPLIPPEHRKRLREWVLSHQHSAGGFCGTSSLVPPFRDYDEWDFDQGTRTAEHTGLANLAASLFALQLLALLADDDDPEGAFRGVDRVQTLRWLRQLQRDDGSFGESRLQLPGRGWFIGGGYDMRYCYIATCIRWILRGDVREGDAAWVEDFNTEKLVQYILDSQTYDGGFAGSSEEEPHAGYAYCAIGALTLLDRPWEGSTAGHASRLHQGIRDKPGLVHWLASRQFVYLLPLGGGAAAESFDRDEDPVNFVLPAALGDLALDENTRHVGFNGRCNKIADTCYCWWVGAALANLGRADVVQRAASRRFLLERLQHRVGGFGKYPGSPPDVYHAFFGLATLGVMGEPGVKPCDSSLAVPVETVRTIEKARRGLLKTAGRGGAAGSLAQGLLDMGLAVRGTKPGWLAAVGG
ncbi:terpenoid cyclases/protein prenyltransferase alpha-alpha toroid [Lasiosphaeria ovina]|uniref:Terpenoid cyclases/protein prenyltransferase alpha-alpha toroid n=1 Tax=Lasiosphaeria ovina TaxID=92902 RepID=A0AAE0NAJ7_9PEZI|nr:terpenoid cyclases/protein prenyltransferase alpha-alpha toroid [Lasiosphaeria ovina]